MKVLIITVVMSFALSFFSFSGGAFADDNIMQNDDIFEEAMDTYNDQIEPVDELAIEEFEQYEEHEDEGALDFEQEDIPETEDEEYIDDRN